MSDDKPEDLTDPKTESESTVETDSSTKNTDKPKRKRTKLKISVAVLAILLLIPILFMGWMGFVPGLSDLFGATKARDLGVQYTDADYSSYLEKTNITLQDFTSAPPNPDKPGKFIVFSNPQTFTDLSVTQEELTAAINEIDWLWMPVKNAQVKLTNGIVEVSGNLNTQYATEFISFIGGVGYSESDVEKVVSYAQKFAADAPVYINATASVEDDKLSFRLNEVQVGRFNVPMDIANTVLSTGTTNAILNTKDLVATSAKPVEGAMLFTGTLPTTVYVKTK